MACTSPFGQIPGVLRDGSKTHPFVVPLTGHLDHLVHVIKPKMAYPSPHFTLFIIKGRCVKLAIFKPVFVGKNTWGSWVDFLVGQQMFSHRCPHEVQIQAPESGGEGWGSALLAVSCVVDVSIVGQIFSVCFVFFPWIMLSSWKSLQSGNIAVWRPWSRMKRRSSWVWKRNCKSWRRRRSQSGSWGWRTYGDPVVNKVGRAIPP